MVKGTAAIIEITIQDKDATIKPSRAKKRLVEGFLNFITKPKAPKTALHTIKSHATLVSP